MKDEFVSSEEIALEREQRIQRREIMLELVRYLTRLMTHPRVAHVPRFTPINFGFSTSAIELISYMEEEFIMLASRGGTIIDID